MLRWGLSLLLAFAVSAAGAAQSQEDNTRTIIVSYETDELSEGDVISFLEQVLEQLRNVGFDMVALEASETASHSPDASLRFSEDHVTISILRSPLAEASPYLEESQARFSLANQGAAGLTSGVLLYSQAECDLAELLWYRYIHFIPGPAYIISVLQSNCALLEGDYRRAIVLWENTSVTSPIQDFNIAWAYLQIGEEETAIRHANLLVRAASCSNCTSNDLVYALVKRSQLYPLASRIDEALADMNTAIELAEANEETTYSLLAELYTERGQRLLLLYEWDAVLVDYNRAIELDPAYAPAYFHRGILYYTQGPREWAIEDFERYLELAPDGEHADEAADYIERIETEQAALEG
jgi:tetratricopeptide (TPR) repeat protein